MLGIAFQSELDETLVLFNGQQAPFITMQYGTGECKCPSFKVEGLCYMHEKNTVQQSSPHLDRVSMYIRFQMQLISTHFDSQSVNQVPGMSKRNGVLKHFTAHRDCRDPLSIVYKVFRLANS